MSVGEGKSLEPEVEVSCVVCRGRTKETICDESEVKAQLAYLERFHRRRLRKRYGVSSDEALADRSEFTQDYATAIVRCTSCGLLFRASRPRADDVAATYAEDTYGRDRLEALHASQVELFRTKTGRVAEFLSAREQPRIIEIGSFVGGFLAAARERGWSALGVDPGEEVALFCREKGFDVLQATADEAPIEDGSADFVAVWNTFDQIPDPRPTLEAIRRWLRPDGVVAVRVPSGPSFRRAMALLRLTRTPRPFRNLLLAAMAWNNLLAFPYLHGHSPDTLGRLAAPFGLSLFAVDADTLTRLADEKTRVWAAWEEGILKAGWRGLARVGLAEAPWLDLYLRRG